MKRFFLVLILLMCVVPSIVIAVSITKNMPDVGVDVGIKQEPNSPLIFIGTSNEDEGEYSIYIDYKTMTLFKFPSEMRGTGE